jgi:SAM-dependent methyltransferase
LDLRSWFFELRYLLGGPPWDTGVTPPEVVELVAGGNLPPGRALDLGCGTGTNCIYLARHGWEAVASCRFYRRDVTGLAFLAAPFDLALDIGCLHSLPPERRDRYAAGVARLVRPGGLYMLYAFTPRPGQPAPRGVTPGEVRSLFASAFVVERQDGGEDPSGPRSAWYWLRRLGPTPA